VARPRCNKSDYSGSSSLGVLAIGHVLDCPGSCAVTSVNDFRASISKSTKSTKSTMRPRVYCPALHSTLNLPSTSRYQQPAVSVPSFASTLTNRNPRQNAAPMSTCIGDRPEQLDVASLTLPTEHIEFELGPPLRQAAWPTDLRKVLLNGPFLSSWLLNPSSYT